jgi:hypothetical protein
MIDILTQNILNLSAQDQDSLFKILSDNAHLLIKVIPNASLLAYIISGTPEDNSLVTQAYTAWKNKQ